MDNLSEYIPLLIIVASAIISIVRKTRQQARKISLPEDILEPEEPQPCFVPEKPIAEKKLAATPVYHKIRTPAKKVPADYKKTIEMPNVDEYESISIDLSDPEEMKKAVIYSEIFNRKDFIVPLSPNF